MRRVPSKNQLRWAVLQHVEAKRDRVYGSLHVGRITDCFGAPEDAESVIRAAASTLAARGVDLMLSNQLHPAWCTRLAERIHAIDPGMRGVHLNRGDGDGPWGQIRSGLWNDDLCDAA